MAVLTTVIIITQSDTTCFLIKVIFQASKFLRTDDFCKKLVCLIFKSLLLFLTYVNFESPYTVEGFRCSFSFIFQYCVCSFRSYDGVITKTRNDFV